MAALLDKLRPILDKVRGPVLALLLLGATAGFGFELNKHYRIQHWLFWSYLAYASVAVLFNLACFSVGFATSKLLVRRGMPMRERLLVAMALGVFVFYLGAFLAGVFHLYGTVYFVLYPLLLLGAGAYPLWRQRRALKRWFRPPDTQRRPWSHFERLAFAFGIIALGIVYAGVIVPENTAYDARWYHIPIAEHYAARGGIEPFVEGWFQGTLPHLSSFIYTWVMLMPVGDLVDKVITCAHIEFSLFLWTLFGIPVVVHWALPKIRSRATWPAIFLFPGILLYDSSLNTTADHIAAFWALPVFLAAVRAFRSLEPRRCLVLAVLIAAALSTKYQAASVVVAPILAIFLRWVYLVAIQRGKGWHRLLHGPALAALAITVLFAPHWLKNLLWYGDPAYPWMHKVFHSKMWTEDTLHRMGSVYEYHLWQPQGTTLQKLRETVVALWEFSFKPHDWWPMHRDWPVFGSLFTLLTVALPFARAPRRVWAVFGAGVAAVFTWYWMSHQDRYLQALLPLLVVFVVSIIVLVWRSGWVARVGLVPLVALQVIWGGDIPFYGHSQLGRPPIQLAVERVSSGFNGKRETRKAAFDPLAKVGDYLPKGSKVLMHEEQSHLGLQTMAVVDWPEWQGGLSYARFRSPAELHDRLVSYGVTHIVMVAGRSRDVDTLPGDAVFFDYVTHFAKRETTIGPWTVMAIASERPPDTPYRKILWLGMDNMYTRGLYDFPQMTILFTSKVPKEQVPQTSDPVDVKDLRAVQSAIDQADVIAIDPKIATLPTALLFKFTMPTRRTDVQVWIRRRANAAGLLDNLKTIRNRRPAAPGTKPTITDVLPLLPGVQRR
ncbi:MAG: hypothetical protein R3B13_21555 [Polyangiaceae bacterium]